MSKSHRRMPNNEKFTKWLLKKDIYQHEAAKELGVTQPAVCYWCLGTVVPKKKYRLLIEEYTDGDVLADRWKAKKRDLVSERQAKHNRRMRVARKEAALAKKQLKLDWELKQHKKKGK